MPAGTALTATIPTGGRITIVEDRCERTVIVTQPTWLHIRREWPADTATASPPLQIELEAAEDVRACGPRPLLRPLPRAPQSDAPAASTVPPPGGPSLPQMPPSGPAPAARARPPTRNLRAWITQEIEALPSERFTPGPPEESAKDLLAILDETLAGWLPSLTTATRTHLQGHLATWVRRRLLSLRPTPGK